MSEEAKKETTEHINLKVLGQDGQVVHFKIKQHTSLKKLMSAYCARSKLAQTTVRFRFDGQAISENDTPRGLDMEDGDTIEVFQQQLGGLLQPIGICTPCCIHNTMTVTTLTHSTCSDVILPTDSSLCYCDSILPADTRNCDYHEDGSNTHKGNIQMNFGCNVRSPPETSRWSSFS